MAMDIPDMKIRTVRVLGGRCKDIAREMGLSDDDMVIVHTTYLTGGLPIYELEKIIGSPTQYIQDKYLDDERKGGE